MEKPFRLLVLASLVAIPLTLQARVCVVHDLDTTACQKGDDLLFMPHTYGSDQLPIEFAGKKCDFNKQIDLNKGGVVCTYAGAKEIVDAKEDPQKKNYAAKYSEVQQNAEGWYQYDDQYWRLLPEQKKLSLILMLFKRETWSNFISLSVSMTKMGSKRVGNSNLVH